MRLAGAIAVVTGGGSGLGAALMRLLAREGARPVVVDLRAERVHELAREGGPAVSGFTCDVADRSRVGEVFAEIGTRLGRVDLLVNCAGRSMLVPFLAMSERDLEWVLGPNFFGVVNTIRAAVPWMPRGSRIVNVTSVSARIPTPGEALYSAAKAAVASLSEALDAELEGRGIRVTVALPGEMSTGLFAEHPSWSRRPDFQRRMEVPPERVARAILRAVRRDRFEVVAPLTMRLPLLLQRMAPRFFRRGVTRFYRRVCEPRIAPQ